MSDAPATEPKQPTVARALRVETFISVEPAFKALLGAKTSELTRKDGNVVKLFPASVEIARRLDEAGKDANVIPKAEILAAARDFFAVAPGAPLSVTTPPPATATDAGPASTMAIHILLASCKSLLPYDTAQPATRAARKKALEELAELYRNAS